MPFNVGVPKRTLCSPRFVIWTDVFKFVLIIGYKQPLKKLHWTTRCDKDSYILSQERKSSMHVWDLLQIQSTCHSQLII